MGEEVRGVAARGHNGFREGCTDVGECTVRTRIVECTTAALNSTSASGIALSSSPLGKGKGKPRARGK